LGLTAGAVVTVPVLILALDAPLMSFGAPIVDNRGETQMFPALSMLTGLLGNSLAYDHSHSDLLSDLQGRIRFAARADHSGQLLRDYQTVDLGLDFMYASRVGWTTRGRVEDRAGAPENKHGTHVRLRDYLADASYTVAVTLTPVEGPPSLDTLEDALRHPARPLFVGRKHCIPTGPILLARVEAESPLDALRRLPIRARSGRTDYVHPPISSTDRPGAMKPRTAGRGGGPTGGSNSAAVRKIGLSAWWFDDEHGAWVPEHSRRIRVVDERNWSNQMHGGARWMCHGVLDVPLDPNRVARSEASVALADKERRDGRERPGAAGGPRSEADGPAGGRQ